MSFAPQQDWDSYAAVLARRNLRRRTTESSGDAETPGDAFNRYAEYYNVILDARSQQAGESRRKLVTDQRQQEKLSLRRCLVAIYQSLDTRASDNTSHG